MKTSKSIWLFAIIFFIGISSVCVLYFANTPFGFKPNRVPWSTNADYKSIIKEHDFVIAYEISGFFGERDGYRILARKGGLWKKIRITSPTRSFDLKRNKVSIENLTTENAQLFLDSLISLGMFQLKTEHELLQKCGKEDVPRTIDGYVVTIDLVAGYRIRKLVYSNPDQWIRQCNQEEWTNIVKIIKFFEQQW